MPIRFYYTGKAKETSSHPQSSFMFHFHLLTLKIQMKRQVIRNPLSCFIFIY